MRRMLSAVTGLWLVACGGTTPGGGGAGGGGSTGGGNGSNQQAPCSASNKCPAGQFCFNGLCAVGCQSNGDCAADQYCDTADLGPPYFCKNKTVSSCPATPCASNQECRQGLCSARLEPNAASCTPRQDFNDGCDKYAICYDEDDEGPKNAYCYSFPPCPQDGRCPVGLEGAVCNEQYIPNKGRFCITGACKDVSNCPAEWKCVKQTANQVLGFCSSGGPNAPCFSNADCLSNNCFNPGGPGFMGFCQ